MMEVYEISYYSNIPNPVSQFLDLLIYNSVSLFTSMPRSF